MWANGLAGVVVLALKLSLQAPRYPKGAIKRKITQITAPIGGRQPLIPGEVELATLRLHMKSSTPDFRNNFHGAIFSWIGFGQFYSTRVLKVIPQNFVAKPCCACCCEQFGISRPAYVQGDVWHYSYSLFSCRSRSVMPQFMMPSSTKACTSSTSHSGKTRTHRLKP